MSTARLGPLPGWSAGYGFDLHEWVSKDQLRAWQSYMRDRFGWQHLLSSRATDLQSSDHINGYSIEDHEHGEFTALLIERVFKVAKHPLQGAKSSLGILRLQKYFGPERLERACQRALHIQAISYKSVRSILKKGLDRLPPPEAPLPSPAMKHSNIRGAEYYR